MTSIDKERLLLDFKGNPPAAPASIERFEAESHFRLPEDYVLFLREANGGEGFIGPDAFVMLWRVEELSELNKGYQIAEYAPGLVLFGSNGGGDGFAFDARSDAKQVVSVPFVGMDLSLVQPLGANFTEFLEAMFRFRF